MIISLLAIICILVVLTGVVVWLRNPWHRIYQTFLGLTLSGALWILTNVLYQISSGEAQYIAALVSYGSIGLFASFFVAFSYALVARTKSLKRILTSGIVLSLFFSLPNITATGISDGRIITTPLLIVYALLLIGAYTFGIAQLVRGRSEVAPQRRQQITTLLKGVMITFIAAGICNLILPILGNYQFVQFGPAFSSVFIAFFAYTIVRHQLFDIKRTIARLMVYVLSVGILGALLGYLSFMVFIQYGDLEVTQFTFIISGLFIAILFPMVKRLFDALTKRLLFSNAYDIQDAIDRMTYLFSSTTSQDHLIKISTRELTSILDASTVSVLFDPEPTLSAYARRLERPVVLRDYLEDEAASEKVLQFMKDKALAVYTPLTVNKKTIGLLCIGDKANGSSYNMLDMEFIDIISDEFAIAMQNTQRLEEIKHFNEALQSKIKDATAELRLTNKKLREIDATKDEFISMASHQLRTPLTSIKGYISMLLDGDLGAIKPEQKKALEEAYDSSQRMVYLIGDFLNLSRLQTGRFELERKPVQLSQLLGEEIDQLRQSASSRHVTLLYEAPSDFPTLQIDETKIRQVMMNFIDNAIYYAKPEGGEVLIVLEAQRDTVHFKVKDNGIGVPVQAKKQLFTKFFRADNAKKARPDGTGIGLYMAKRVVLAHDGRILFDSKEGAGSEFGFELPVN